MMIFTADMKPRALLQNKGTPHTFTCEFCGAMDEGFKVQPGNPKREAWAVLPAEWAEFEDRREGAKKQFRICYENGDCQHEAARHAE